MNLKLLFAAFPAGEMEASRETTTQRVYGKQEHTARRAMTRTGEHADSNPDKPNPWSPGLSGTSK